MKHLLFVLLLCGVAVAEPNPTVNYLMNEPTTMWDLGMWRLTEKVKELKLEGYSPFSTGDINDWPDLVSRLINAKNADRPSPGKRIWALLSPSTRDLLQFRASAKFTHRWPIFMIEQSVSVDSLLSKKKAKFWSKIEDENKDKHTIINELNEILSRRDFYHEEDFHHLTLTEEILDLLSQGQEELPEKNLQKFNRLLLETAYPYNIEKSQLKASFDIKGVVYNLEKNRIEIFVEDSVRRQSVQEAKTACKNIIANLQRMFGISSHTGNPLAGRKSSVIEDYFSHQGFTRLDEPSDLSERLDEMVDLTAFVGSQTMCQCKLRSSKVSFGSDIL